MIGTNFYGQVNGARAVLPIFRGQGYGTLINVASVDARLPQLDASAYTASKHGIQSFGMNLRPELLLCSAGVSLHGAWNPAAQATGGVAVGGRSIQRLLSHPAVPQWASGMARASCQVKSNGYVTETMFDPIQEV